MYFILLIELAQIHFMSLPQIVELMSKWPGLKLFNLEENSIQCNAKLYTIL